jgi:ribosomal protein L40E
MALAICINCGAQKTGAFMECNGCGFEPSRAKDKARSIFLSEHHFSKDDLEIASKIINAGERMALDEYEIDQYFATIEELQSRPRDTQWKNSAQIVLMLQSFLAILFLLAIISAFWIGVAHLCVFVFRFIFEFIVG